MQIIDGHQYGTRQDLVEHTGYSTATLSDFWKDRVSNGHPPARIIDGVMHWDVDEWDRWYAEFQRTRRNAAKPIDRSGDPDEELRPADQARVLGLPRNMIAQYRKKPPNGWPKPTRVEDLPAGGVREFRTRRQLWEYHDTTNRIGTAGRRAATGPDPRVQIAADALAAQPDRAAGDIAADLAEAHGQSVHTWKRIITAARRQTQ
ncbi:hypothetical protein ABZ951_15820 [Streptomyces sp. NPDC046215]|uniref:Uncharacterized protein n=1 Tax=Streptomyces stramineus TaxID=173861 RepID=A0ABN1A0I8_9ACTN